jgi:hypothetical protein
MGTLMSNEAIGFNVCFGQQRDYTGLLTIVYLQYNFMH